MTPLTTLLSPNVMHNLGWTLLHFLWQGTAIAALTAVLMTACRHASTRYALAVAALVLMLAAPLATFFLLPRSLAPATEKSSPVLGTSIKSASGSIAKTDRKSVVEGKRVDLC